MSLISNQEMAKDQREKLFDFLEIQEAIKQGKDYKKVLKNKIVRTKSAMNADDIAAVEKSITKLEL